jgi:N-acetylneuraminic acid mutarotase
MKNKLALSLIKRGTLKLLLSTFTAFYAAQLSTASAQGTAFTYQGKLNDGGNPANGRYDLTFSLFNGSSGGSAAAGPLTNAATVISNGLFTVPLDFGPAVFSGTTYWLAIGVRTNNGGAFTPVAPRQQLTPAPYAVFAEGANAAGLSGTIAAGNIANGSIGANQLATGAAAANLQAGGQSAVPGGGMILSSNFNDGNLAGAGYVKLGFVNLGDVWDHEADATLLAGRGYHRAVWTGTEMIVWGGYNGSSYFNDGGRYNPAANTWAPVNTNGAPAPRQYFTAVWTGNEMIIWGGYDGVNYFNDGARYNPIANTWTAVNTNGAPSGRDSHTGVWTGSELIVWGGLGSAGALNDGGRYNPTANTWTTVNTNGAPFNRASHTAVWTGNQMIVWGGLNGFSFFNDGGRYNPAANTWTNVSILLSARAYHTAVWTASEMIVWGGIQIVGLGGNIYGDGGRYNPVTDIWTLIPTNSVVAPRALHTAMWTGREMIIWGGNNTKNLNDGARYDPASANPWMAITVSGAPAARYVHTAVWTGNTMIIWGGIGSSNFNDTFTYTPSRLLYLYQRP